MEYSQEQIDIANCAFTNVSTNDIILVQAFAGSGKSTMLECVASKLSSNLKILSICFGKAVQENSERIFNKNANVDSKTFDSYCYRAFFNQNESKTPQNLTAYSMQLEHHQTKAVCKKAFKELDTYMSNPKGKKPEHWLALKQWMIYENKRGDYTNYKFLRKYQQLLGTFATNYDVLLVDECQDLDPIMIDTILKFKGMIIMVGDEFQHIFSFMGSVCAFDLVREISNRKVHEFHLTKSFRFGKNIANISMSILNQIFMNPPNEKGLAIRVDETKKDHIFYFNSHHFVQLDSLDECTVLATRNSTIFDIAFHLSDNGRNFQMIGKEKFIPMLSETYEKYKKYGYKYINDKKQEAEACGNFEVSGIYALILQYKEKIVEKVEKLKKYITDNSKIILSTIHKSKGLQWKTVLVLDDKFKKETDYRKFDEKKRLYYVAFTRSCENLYVEKSLLEYFGIEYYKERQAFREFQKCTKFLKLE